MKNNKECVVVGVGGCETVGEQCTRCQQFVCDMHSIFIGANPDTKRVCCECSNEGEYRETIKRDWPPEVARTLDWECCSEELSEEEVERMDGCFCNTCRSYD